MQPRTITGLTVHIDSFQALAGGTVNTWNVCDGAFDSAQRQRTGGGCGGAFGGADVLQATFSSVASGASEPATATPGNEAYSVPLPLTIKPGMSAFFAVDIVGFTDGTYHLSFQLTAHGAAPVSIAPLSPPIMIAKQARKWSGDTCQSMAAHIRTTSTPEEYVCPPAWPTHR